MKYLSMLIFVLSLITAIACQDVANVKDKFERISEEACGCLSRECAEKVFNEYKDLTMKYVHHEKFAENAEYLNILFEDISDCLVENGIDQFRIRSHYITMKHEFRR